MRIMRESIAEEVVEEIFVEEQHPIKEIWEHLLQADALLRELQGTHEVGEELFEWTLNYAQELLKFHRTIRLPGIMRER